MNLFRKIQTSTEIEPHYDQSCFRGTEVILSEKRSTAEMGAEALREAGTLVIVFSPMYDLFEPARPSWEIFLLLLIAGFILLALGIEVERRRT
jgi:hypothetical protein